MTGVWSSWLSVVLEKSLPGCKGLGHCGGSAGSKKVALVPEEAMSYLERHKLPVSRYLERGKGTRDCAQPADGLASPRCG